MKKIVWKVVGPILGMLLTPTALVLMFLLPNSPGGVGISVAMAIGIIMMKPNFLILQVILLGAGILFKILMTLKKKKKQQEVIDEAVSKATTALAGESMSRTTNRRTESRDGRGGTPRTRTVTKEIIEEDEPISWE